MNIKDEPNLSQNQIASYEDVQADEVFYDTEKDFYEGARGELRFNAEGLLKKAKEKGISIEKVDIITLNKKTVDFPGIGSMDLDAYVVKVKGKELSTGREVADVKQIDYFNIYQKYIAEKIQNKDTARHRKQKQSGDDKIQSDNLPGEHLLTNWEKFEIGKAIIDDKEFGLEKTVTGACDRVIRKLMGENHWLYPKEAKMLETEFNEVNKRIQKEANKTTSPMKTTTKKASERQKNYLKVKIKNSGFNPDSQEILNRVVSEMGFKNKTIDDLSMTEMSKVIENVPTVLSKLSQQH